MEKAGCEYVVMEVSSHSLDQNRVAGLTLKWVFTNLTQDHLDYHGTMENYYQAKRKLFDHCRARRWWMWMTPMAAPAGESPLARVKTYSVQGNPADYMAGRLSPCRRQRSISCPREEPPGAGENRHAGIFGKRHRSRGLPALGMGGAGALCPSTAQVKAA